MRQSAAKGKTCWHLTNNRKIINLVKFSQIKIPFIITVIHNVLNIRKTWVDMTDFPKFTPTDKPDNFLAGGWFPLSSNEALDLLIAAGTLCSVLDRVNVSYPNIRIFVCCLSSRAHATQNQEIGLANSKSIRI